jgi:hypothetical protein
MTTTSMPVAVVIPAKDEAARIAETIHGVRTIPGVRAVVVVDDGSTDGTAAIAAREGAEVVRHPRNHGKADAMMSGLGRVSGLRRVGRLDEGTSVLFVDADLEASAQAATQPAHPEGERDVAVLRSPVHLRAPVGAGDPVLQVAGHLEDGQPGVEHVDRHADLDTPAAGEGRCRLDRRG